MAARKILMLVGEDGRYVEVAAHEDGNLVTAPAWLGAFPRVLGTRIEP